MTYEDCEPFRPGLSRGICRFLAVLASVVFGLTSTAGLAHGLAMVNGPFVRICIGESSIRIPLSNLPGGDVPDNDQGSNACHAACLSGRRRGSADMAHDDAASS